MLTEKTFDANGITLNYAEGDGTGSPMILLHGSTGWWQGWQPHYVDTYGGDWHQYLIDLRGHGKSERVTNGSNYRIVDFAGDVVEFLKQLDEPAVPMGHSAGALTCVGVASMMPDKVRGVVLFDPPIFVAHNGSINMTPGFKGFFEWVYSVTDDKVPFDDVLEMCREMSPDASEDEIKLVAERIVQVAPDTMKCVLEDRLGEAHDVPQALQGVTCPTLLLYGDWDAGAAVREQDVALMHEHVANLTVAKIDGGDHVFLWNRWDETRPHVDTFLAAL